MGPHPFLHTYIHAYTFMRLYAHTHADEHTLTHTHSHTHTRTHTHSRTHTHAHTRTHTLAHTHTLTHSRTRSHTHTHTHAHTRTRPALFSSRTFPTSCSTRWSPSAPSSAPVRLPRRSLVQRHPHFPGWVSPPFCILGSWCASSWDVGQ